MAAYRRSRSTADCVQVNLRLPPEVHRLLVASAAHCQISQAEAAEEAIVFYCTKMLQFAGLTVEDLLAQAKPDNRRRVIDQLAGGDTHD